MGLLLSVDDSSNAAYKILAENWRRQYGINAHVFVEFHSADEIETVSKMRKVIASAQRKQCTCVMFVVDQESHDPNKRPLLRRIGQAFDELCTDPPKDMTVGLIVAHSCLECWLLTDVQAIVRFQAGNRGVNYIPTQSGQTERYTPLQAGESITHIMRQVARQRGARELKRVRYEKSKSGEIAEQMQELATAAQRNRSLAYFFEMVVCDQNGCEYRQP